MCGILAVLRSKQDIAALRKRIVQLATRLRHRGPDWSGVHVQGNNVFAHERLAIVGIDSGSQPLLSKDKSTVLVVNGEIYNHKELRAQLRQLHAFQTESDCEVLMYLYEEEGPAFLNRVQGDFAFVVSDGKSFMAARDPIGVCPLYIGYGADGSIWFASEMKALIDDCEKIETFPPGHYYTPEAGFQRYWNPQWFYETPTQSLELKKLREALEKAVTRRMMCDVPYGVLLSGGLDSSLVAAIVVRYCANRMEEDFKSPAWWPRVHSFCIGLGKDSPDQIAAREVAKFLGTVHHEFTFTIQDGLDAIERVIYHLETYDVTTVRASTPMYLLARKIKALGVKMVLSGEGSDEVFGGYLYFHNAPNVEEFHKETVRRVQRLHLADCLRANKSTAAWGVEVRVPFLDKDFLDVAMSCDPQLKMCTPERMEKWILRKAFDDENNPYLPKSVLWRQKEQFSDGVGYGWIDELKRYCEEAVSDEEFARAKELYPHNTPETKEGFYFRQIFEKLFPHQSAKYTVEKWIPTWSSSTDPSGRAQKVHVASTI